MEAQLDLRTTFDSAHAAAAQDVEETAWAMSSSLLETGDRVREALGVVQVGLVALEVAAKAPSVESDSSVFAHDTCDRNILAGCAWSVTFYDSMHRRFEAEQGLKRLAFGQCPWRPGLLTCESLR